MVFGPTAAVTFAKKQLDIRNDPFLSSRFLLEIEGLIAGGFTEIDGLGITTETQTIREGGVNDGEYKLPKITTYQNLQLSYGVTAFDMMWNWYKDVLGGKIKRKNGTIYLLGEDSLPVIWWDFFNAWPVQWQGPSFKADSSIVAVQTLTLTHQGISLSKLSQAYSMAKVTV